MTEQETLKLKTEYFLELHRDLPREAPGSKTSTNKAINIVKAHTNQESLSILDVGCGTGNATLELIQHFPKATFFALDINNGYLQALKERLKDSNTTVNFIEASMFDTSKLFSQHQFDLIWAEGSVYIIGFQKGLEEWKGLLKPNGKSFPARLIRIIAASELSWLHSDPPEEVQNFWNQGNELIDGGDVSRLPRTTICRWKSGNCI